MRIPAAVLFLVSALAASASPTPSGAVGGPVRVPSDDLPEVVRRLGPLDGVIAVAISEDLAQAGAVIADSAVRGRTRLRLATLSDAGFTEVELPGVGRSLVFAPGGSELFVIVSREIRKAGAETFLVSVEPDSLKATRRTNLPATAADMVVDPRGELLLVAGENEVRTFRLPVVSSGLVYVVAGGNRSIGAIPGGQRILLGRDDGLFVVDLSDPQAREGMPVRERLLLPGRVSRIALRPDGMEGLLRLDNGDAYRIELDPLRVEAAGRAAAIAWPGDGRAPASPSLPSTPPPRPPPEAPLVLVVASPTPAPSNVAPATALPETAPTAPPALDKGRLRGVILGPTAELGAAVIVLGPDNLLHEAARATPGPDGAWVVDGLEPGSYRVMLDAGGGRQLLLDPPFRSARVEAGRETRVADIKILRSL